MRSHWDSGGLATEECPTFVVDMNWGVWGEVSPPERVEVVEHHMVGLWQKCRLTGERCVLRFSPYWVSIFVDLLCEEELTEMNRKHRGGPGFTIVVVTIITLGSPSLLTLLRMIWRRWGGRTGGPALHSKADISGTTWPTLPSWSWSWWGWSWWGWSWWAWSWWG